MGMAATRSGGGGVRLRGDGVHVWGYRGFLVVALLFVTATMFVIEDVHCSSTTNAVAPTPTPSTQQTQDIVTFNPDDAEALNAVLRMWSKENPRLSTHFNWTLDKHPCDNLNISDGDLTSDGGFLGAWFRVWCASVLRNETEIPKHYLISVTSLSITPLTCVRYNGTVEVLRESCGLDEIIGDLPSLEISRLTNLQYLEISNNPRLTGSVPVELFQMPNLKQLRLDNNSLSGTLPSDVYVPNCTLEYINLSNNNFNGSLQVSSNGTLFCLSLLNLDVSFNQLDGQVDLLHWRSDNETTLDLSNNHFVGTFSIGPNVNVSELDLSYNDFTSTRFANYSNSTQSNGLGIIHMPSLSYLDISMNQFGGPIDFRSMNKTPRLKYLNMSNNNFKETFFTGSYFNPMIMDLSNNQLNNMTFHVFDGFINGTSPINRTIFLPALEKIYFQNNNLSGKFPTEVLTAPKLQILNASQNRYNILQPPPLQFHNSSLFHIYITNNKLDEVEYPKSGPFSFYNLQFSSLFFLGGNPMCNKIEDVVLSSICRLNERDEPQPVIPKSNTKMKIIIATSTSSCFVLVLLVTAIYVWRLMGRIKALHIILEEFDKKEVKPNLYSYREVKLATNNFDKDNKLGEGGFGVVYKGEIFDGTQIAVKKLTMSSNQVLHEFLNEVVVISGLKHRNLVKLKGCCLGDGDQYILVFEYVENNNLAEASWMQGDLYNNIEPPCLDWETRFNIIVGIARGLAYLHEELQPPIIHRDIKATNILLDKNYNPKIADFGLAYLFPTLDNEASHLTLIQVAGTRGYCSPEYILHGHVSTALDVYSFGILVLEIVSGRKNIDLQKPSEEIYLRDWAWKQYEAKATMTLIDPKMEHSPLALDAIVRVIVVALACVHYKAARRPKMQEVLSMLFGNMPIIEFQRDFEYGGKIIEVCAQFPLTLGSTSSLWSNENLHVDDCYLLSNSGDIEMNSIIRSNGLTPKG